MGYELFTLEHNADDSSQDNLTLLVRWLEPVLLAAVAPLLLFAESAPVLVVQLGIALLLLPYLLRKIVYGYFLIHTTATLLIGVLVFVTLPISIWVAPLEFQYVWPEAARIVWSVAVLLAVIQWVFRADSSIDLTPDLTIDLTTDTTEFTRPVRVDRQGRLPKSVIQLTTVYLFIGVIFTISSLLILRSANKLPLLTALAEHLPQLYSFWLLGFFNNEIGGIVLLFLPLAIALLVGVTTVGRYNQFDWLRRGAVRVVLLALVLLFGAALLLAQSRAAWVGAGLSLVVILPLLGRRGQVLLLLLASTAMIALLLIGPAALFNELTVQSNIRTTDEIVTGVLADRNLSARYLIWQRALHGIADAPLTGMGLTAFQWVALQPYTPLGGYQIDNDIHHAHNLFLQIGVDLGLPGLLTFSMLLLTAVLALVRCYRRTPAQSPMRTWTIGLAGSLLAYLVYSMFDTVTIGAQRGVAFWFLLGLCLAAGELRISRSVLQQHSVGYQSAEAMPQYDLQPLVHVPTATDGFTANQTGQPLEYPTWVFLVEKTPQDPNE